MKIPTIENIVNGLEPIALIIRAQLMNRVYIFLLLPVFHNKLPQ